jgi:hypothetical protein
MHGVPGRHVSLSNVIKAKKRGCQICYAVLKGLALLVQSPVDEDPESYLLSIFSADLSLLDLIMQRGQPLEVAPILSVRQELDGSIPVFPNIQRLGIRRGLGLDFGFEIFSDPLSPTPWDGLGSAREVPSKLKPAQRQKMIRRWIQRCDKTHPDCQAPLRKTSHFPRRLIDLSGNPRNAVQLVDAKDVTATYATVSYRSSAAASAAISVLTRSNLAERLEKKMRWIDLPPGFHDAILVASEQGIRYLWIDVLCVVQDDINDYQFHNEIRHHIYGRSYLNIALTRAVDARETSLGKRWVAGKSVEMLTQYIQLSHGGEKYRVGVRSKLYDSHVKFDLSEVYTIFDLLSWNYDMSEFSPLLSQAGPIFDTVLAPRTVHFHFSEMVWECGTASACECSMGESKLPLSDVHGSPSTMSQLRYALHPGFHTPPAQLEGLWHGLRSMFAASEIMHDRPRAQDIVMLAIRFQWVSNLRFWAGLLADEERQLCLELLWSVGRGEIPSPKAPYKVAEKLKDASTPSWSWISMSIESQDRIGRIQPRLQGSYTMDADFRVRGVDTDTPAGATPDHPINAINWRLRVRGRLMLGKIEARERLGYKYHFVPANAMSFAPAFPPQSLSSGFYLGKKAIWTEGYTDEAICMPPTVVTPAMGLEHGVPAGEFIPDCDLWDWGRRQCAMPFLRGAIGGRSQDGVGPGNDGYSLAYFLRLGYITSDFFDTFSSVDIGIVLTRSTRASGEEVGVFERVGVFTVAEHFRYFDDTQVQDLILV